MERVRRAEPLSAEETEQMHAVRFDHVRQRVTAALEHRSLDRASVLDVGCRYGNC